MKTKKFNKLPKSWTTVTTFSKLLAMFLFILFPFVGFYLGAQYQAKLDSITIPLALNSTTNEQLSDSSTLKTYTDIHGYSFKYPKNWMWQKSDISNQNLIELVFFNDKATISAADNKVATMLLGYSIEVAKQRLNSRDDPSSTKSTFSETVVSGRKITKANVVNYVNGTIFSKQYYVLIPMGGQTLEIYSDFENKGYIDQILSTFKFTN